MKKLIINATICIILSLITFKSSFAVDLVIPSQISTTLNRELARNTNTYMLNTSTRELVARSFESWVAQTMSFDSAKKTESERFGGRTTMYQELAENIPIFLYERGQKGLESRAPIPVIYRFSPDRYSFRKLLDVEATQKLDVGAAKEFVGSFLSSNNFLKLTQMDTAAEISVPELRQKHPPEPNLPERDVLILQQVRYLRSFMGMPVLNSRVSVDFHPDTLEVLGIKVYNWTAVNENSPVPVPSSQKRTRQQVEDALEEAVKTQWKSTERVTLINVVRGWFQTDTALIPILTCELERNEPDCTGNCQVPINLSGEDIVFYAAPQKQSPEPHSSECFPGTNEQYEDWVAMGSPSCWCNQYQCDGDADGLTQGIGSQAMRIGTLDLQVLIDNWGMKGDEESFNPCADIDHKPQGIGSKQMRVGTNDLQVLIKNWKKKDADLKGDCPRGG